LSKNNILISHHYDNQCDEANKKSEQIAADRAYALSLQIESTPDLTENHVIKSSEPSSDLRLSVSEPSSGRNVESFQEKGGVTVAQLHFAAMVTEAQTQDENQDGDFSLLPSQIDRENVLAAAAAVHESEDMPYCVSVSGTLHVFNIYTFVCPETSEIGSLDSTSNRKSSYICSCSSCDDGVELYGYLIKHMEVKGRGGKSKSKRVFVSRTYLNHVEKPNLDTKYFLLDIVMTLCTVI